MVGLVETQLSDIVANGPTEQELAVAKGAFQGSTLINLEDTGSRMARLATSMVLRDRVLPIDAFLAAVAAVTVDDVRRVAHRVLGVAPTIIDTPGVRQQLIPLAAAGIDVETRVSTNALGRMGVPDDVARVVLFCCSDMAMFMTGSTVAVDAGDLA